MNLAEITPVILTRDEEPNLERTLAQLAWAGDVVVVDSFSTDATVAIARRFANVRVFQRTIDTLAEQSLAQDVGTDPRALQVASLMEHALLGLLDGGGMRSPVAGHVAAPAAAGTRWFRGIGPERHVWALDACRSRPDKQKTPASRRGSLRSCVVRAPSARPSACLRSPAGSR